jgi:hypothetical protein
MELLSFKEFIVEKVEDVSVGGNQGSTRPFPVTIGDRNFLNAASKLPVQRETPEYRTIWNPKNRKFYTWEAIKSIHGGVKEFFGIKGKTVDYGISLNRKIKLTLDNSKSHFSELSTPPQNKEQDEKYFKGFKEGSF